MTRRKKFTSYITMLALAVMMVMSSLTVAKAGDSKTGFSLYTEAYYGKDYDVSDFAEKNTNKSVELSVDYSTGGYDYAGLRVDAVNDSYTAQSGWFIPR